MLVETETDAGDSRSPEGINNSNNTAARDRARRGARVRIANEAGTSSWEAAEIRQAQEVE